LISHPLPEGKRSRRGSSSRGTRRIRRINKSMRKRKRRDIRRGMHKRTRHMGQCTRSMSKRGMGEEKEHEEQHKKPGL
jgi:hypothetical protein